MARIVPRYRTHQGEIMRACRLVARWPGGGPFPVGVALAPCAGTDRVVHDSLIASISRACVKCGTQRSGESTYAANRFFPD
jgi:hypothetical protein